MAKVKYQILMKFEVEGTDEDAHNHMEDILADAKCADGVTLVEEMREVTSW